MRILLLTRYDRLGASSRVRMLQYIHFLESSGWRVDVSPLLSDAYIQALYDQKGRILVSLAGYLRRIKALTQAKKYDLLWIEKELFPFFTAWVERYLKDSGVPYVVDYDDAWFHRYDQHNSTLVRRFLGRKIDDVMQHATTVVTGNAYLAEHAISAGATCVEIVPTVVDIEMYSVKDRVDGQQLTIGWIGSPGTFHYLQAIAPVLEWAINTYGARVVAVGGCEGGVDGVPVDVWRWSEGHEVEYIQKFDVGIMPLPDEAWERGKCGYKLIQYMACGLPVIASPVGVNGEIVTHGENGFLANTVEEWKLALASLLDDRLLRRQMGANGRRRVEQTYCSQVQAPRLDSIFRRAMG